MPQYMQINVKINAFFIYIFIQNHRMSCHNKNYESYEV